MAEFQWLQFVYNLSGYGHGDIVHSAYKVGLVGGLAANARTALGGFPGLRYP
jgi:hypothetical protein